MGLSQAALAVAAGVTSRSIGAWERGESTPQGENLKRVAKALQTKPEWITDGPEIRPNPTQAVSMEIADRVAQFVIGYQELVGVLAPGVEAALTVLLYRECELRGLGDPKELPKSDLHQLLSKATG